MVMVQYRSLKHEELRRIKASSEAVANKMKALLESLGFEEVELVKVQRDQPVGRG